jgi:hypothetical protein
MMNLFAVIMFVIYIPLVLSFGHVDAKWSMAFVIFISLFYLIRDVVAPKEKKADVMNTKDSRR